MISISQIRSKPNKIIIFGEHPAIIQSMLDFDYLSGKAEGSIVGIISNRRGFSKYFFGRNEILIPTCVDLHGFTDSRIHDDSNYWFFNNLSGRRTLSSTLEGLTLKEVPNPAKTTSGEGQTLSGFVGGVIFAEGVPELHSLQIITKNLSPKTSNLSTNLIVGPASVGLVIPHILKLGPIGGITPEQIDEGKLIESGDVAVVSGSGGMTNELINVAIQAGHRLSFALSYGGDRFPVLSPRDAFLLAESDSDTKTVLYYGELGGEDEYELVKLKEEGKFTKNVVAHIAGTVASLFSESPQFGHAKAKADKVRTTATAKREALRSVGFSVSNSFTEFISLVAALGSDLKGSAQPEGKVRP